MKKGKLTAECDISFEEVSVPVLLEGIHYTTDDRVAAELEATRATLRQIVEITSENHDLLVKNTQLSEQLNRNFTRLWNLEMDKLDVTCPNTFILMPSGRRVFDPRNLFNTEFTLYLMCQHPAGPHIVKEQEGYRVPQSKEWWVKIAPWLKHLREFLKYVPVGTALAEAYEAVAIEASLKIFDTVLTNLPEIITADTAERLSPRRGRFEMLEAEGPALRALCSFLEEADKEKRWCGLRKTVTNDGNIFWLCAEHLPLHQPLQ
ncbi:MAG: hypothetical protein H8E47_11815 [Anaerolineales bacterium]|nr:hypothetical protein [Anaerolineales bacterium]